MNKEKSVTNYVVQLDNGQIVKLKNILEERGFEFTKIPYAHWKGKLNKFSITAYESGKLVLQGKETEDFVLFTLEPQVLGKAELGYTNLSEQNKTIVPFTPHIGIDESGKGDFFGPLVVSAAFVDNDSLPVLEKIGVKDSKLIKSDKKILEIAQKIRNTVKGKFTIVAIGPVSYNNVYKKFKNLNRLLAWGHSRALENLLEKEVECEWALSDKFGNEQLIINSLFEKGKKIELRQQTKAESDIAVAAASILARADFVSRVKKLEDEFGVILPKGAGKNVFEAAVKIASEKGADILNNISKTHFKTYEQVLEKIK